MSWFWCCCGGSSAPACGPCHDPVTGEGGGPSPVLMQVTFGNMLDNHPIQFNRLSNYSLLENSYLPSRENPAVTGPFCTGVRGPLCPGGGGPLGFCQWELPFGHPAPAVRVPAHNCGGLGCRPQLAARLTINVTLCDLIDLNDGNGPTSWLCFHATLFDLSGINGTRIFAANQDVTVRNSPDPPRRPDCLDISVGPIPVYDAGIPVGLGTSIPDPAHEIGDVTIEAVPPA